MAKQEEQQQPPLPAAAQPEHHWLERFVGEWSYEVEAVMAPGQPPAKFRGSESVRSLGDLWILAEGRGEMPGGGIARSQLTLGFDPQRQRYVGTWIGSMMTHLWIYSGTLDAEGRVLTLDTEGPDMSTGKMVKYQDVYEFVGDDHRVLSSQLQGVDGTWYRFMTADYRRKP